MEMNLKIAQELKKTMESDIARSIKQFQDATGLYVYGLMIQQTDLSTYDKREFEVRIEAGVKF